MVRNPMDRALSAFKIWNKHPEMLLREAEVFYKKLNQVADRVDCLVYYEDLVRRPEQELWRVMGALGLSDSKVQLSDIRNQNGQEYRPESAVLVDTTGNHKVGTSFEGLYEDRIDIYKTQMSSNGFNVFKNTLSGIEILKRYFE